MWVHEGQDDCYLYTRTFKCSERDMPGGSMQRCINARCSTGAEKDAHTQVHEWRKKSDCKKIESEHRSRPLHHLQHAPEPPTLSVDPMCHVPEGPLSVRGTGLHSGHLELGHEKGIQGCMNIMKENKRLQINVSLPQMNGSRQLSGAIHIHPQLSKAN